MLALCPVLNFKTNFYCACSQKENLQYFYETVTILIWWKANCNRVLILARGHKNKYKHACFDLNMTGFTSLHFQVVLPALWSVPPSEQQVPLYWIGKNSPGEGFGSSSPCSVVGTHLVNTYLLRLTNITLIPNSCLQENIYQCVQWQYTI